MDPVHTKIKINGRERPVYKERDTGKLYMKGRSSIFYLRERREK